MLFNFEEKKTNYAVSHLINLMTMPCEYLVNAETMTLLLKKNKKKILVYLP